jgi:DinB superfamily
MASEGKSPFRFLGELRAMTDFLREAASRFPGDAALAGGPSGGFCFVEQVWHLADLETEAYGRRIERILREDGPSLDDFDGAHAARERAYRSRSLAEGLERFASARARNLEVLEGLGRSQWERPATQDGVGSLALFDIPRMMAEHDASHRDEIRVLLGEAPPTADGSRVA